MQNAEYRNGLAKLHQTALVRRPVTSRVFFTTDRSRAPLRAFRQQLFNRSRGEVRDEIVKGDNSHARSSFVGTATTGMVYQLWPHLLLHRA